MLASWFRGVLRFRLVMLALAAGVVAAGVLQLRAAEVDVLPEFAPPYAEIQTEALGLSAEEVEQLITVPLEADLLNGVEGVDVIRSDSVPGLSSVVLVFAPGTDVYRARQLVEERLTQAHALPNVSKPPTLLPPLSASSRVLMIGLTADRLTPIEQSVIARWTIRPRLMGVPGVANVSVWGMRDQQLQVRVDPQRLRDQGVTLNQVVESAGNAQVVSPLTFLEASTPGTGGFVESPQQRLQVRHVLEAIADPRELGKVPVTGTGGRLRLSDVADITVDHQPLIGDAVVAGGAGLMLVVEKFPGASALDVTRGVEDALDKLRPGLAGMQTDTSVFRPASYVEDALGNLTLVLAVGGVLMLLVLLALRFRWRAVLVVAVTVPLSLLVAVFLLQLFGQGLNALVLAGLAAAVTVVVDEAVAPTERVVRRLRQRRQGNGSVSLGDVVRDASTEARRPLLYATVIVLLAVVPVAVMAGRPGAFLDPLVLAYVLAVVGSLGVALTITPALTVVLFTGWGPAAAGHRARRMTDRYSSLAGRLGRRTAFVAAGAVALVGLATLPLLDASLVPTFQDRAVLVRLEAEPGTSNPRMTELAGALSRQLQTVPGVDNVGAHVGRAVTGDRVTNVSSGDIWVSVAPDADYDATLAAIDETVRTAAQVRHEVTTYSTQRIRDVGGLTRGDNRVSGTDLALLTGVDKPLVVRLFGQDSDVLRREAERVREAMAGVEGVVAPTVELPKEQPSIEVEVDLDKAQALGITPGDVRRAEATLLQGIQVGSVFQKQKVFDVIVQGVPSTRRSVEDVRNLLIDRPGGGHLTLGQVADVRVADTPAVIQRDAVSRRVDVTADVSGRSAAAVADAVESRLAKMDFPLEYHAEVLRESTAAEIGMGRVIGFAAGAAVAALLLLQAAFRSWRRAFLVYALLPLTLVGGLVVALVDGATVSLGSLLGLLAVLALATRFGTSFVAGLQSLERESRRGRWPSPPAALVRRGAAEQLMPVLASTAAVAALLLPVALAGTRPGLEIVRPMALVALGGLVTCAFVTLFLLPALYLRLVPHTGLAQSDGEAEPGSQDLEPPLVVDRRLPRQVQAPIEAEERH